MNVLGSKDELVYTSFSVKFRLQPMQTCSDCHQYLAEIDGLCPFCRAVQRLNSELRRLGPGLRGWAIDQTRVWASIVQEEAGKWEKGAEAARKAAEEAASGAATPKAASHTVFSAPEPEAAEQPPGEGQPPKEEVKTEEKEPEAAGPGIVSPGKISSSSEEEIVPEKEPSPVKEVEEDIESKPKKKEKKSKKALEQEESQETVKEKRDKKQKTKKKDKRSRSRTRVARRDSRRPKRGRSSRSRTRERRSPRRGDRRPPEPANPPSGWRGASQHRTFGGGQYYPPGDPNRYDANWGENKGQKKRKKQQVWRDGRSGGSY